MHRWRYPSLSLHGIQGAFYEPGAKTVIPRKVSGKFSIRLVPNQTPDKTNQLVNDYLNKMWKLRESPNMMNIVNHHGGKPWMSGTTNIKQYDYLLQLANLNKGRDIPKFDFLRISFRKSS